MMTNRLLSRCLDELNATLKEARANLILANQRNERLQQRLDALPPGWARVSYEDHQRLSNKLSQVLAIYRDHVLSNMGHDYSNCDLCRVGEVLGAEHG